MRDIIAQVLTEWGEYKAEELYFACRQNSNFSYCLQQTVKEYFM